MNNSTLKNFILAVIIVSSVSQLYHLNWHEWKRFADYNTASFIVWCCADDTDGTNKWVKTRDNPDIVQSAGEVRDGIGSAFTLVSTGLVFSFLLYSLTVTILDADLFTHAINNRHLLLHTEKGIHHECNRIEATLDKLVEKDELLQISRDQNRQLTEELESCLKDLLEQADTLDTALDHLKDKITALANNRHEETHQSGGVEFDF